MNDIKAGDIVRVAGAFYHVERVHRDGLLDCIADADDKRCGLNPRLHSVEKATLAELVEHREQQKLLAIMMAAQ